MRNEMLEKAFDEYFEEKYGHFFNPSGEKHKFSLAYRIRKRNIIRSVQRKDRSYHPMPLSKVKLIIIAVILSVLVLTGFCVYWIVNGFHFEVHREYSTVHFESAENDKTEIAEIYSIVDVKGAILLEQDIVNGFVQSEYSYKSEIVVLSQMIPEFKWNVNTENQAVEPIDVNGGYGFYISMNNDTESYLVWKLDGYIFTIGGKITKEEALILAKSTKIK